MDDKKFTLKAVRNYMGLSQEEFGKLIGVSKNVIYNWEKHKSYPNAKEINKIVEVSGFPYDNIIFLP